MNYRQLLTALGPAARIDIDAAVKAGSCTIAFDASVGESVGASVGASVDITLETDPYDSEETVLYLHAAVASVGDCGDGTLFGRLLQLHVFGLSTGHAVFGVDDASQRILFLKRVVLKYLETSIALGIVGDFINQAVRWRGFLPSLGAPTAPDLALLRDSSQISPKR